MFQNGEQAISNSQSQLMATELQLSSGKQINTPSDNPIGAANIASLTSTVSQLTQYKSNQDEAQLQLNLADSTMTSFNNLVQDVQQKLVQAGDASYSDTQRAALAQGLQGDLNQMVGLANTSDDQGATCSPVRSSQRRRFRRSATASAMGRQHAAVVAGVAESTAAGEVFPATTCSRKSGPATAPLSRQPAPATPVRRDRRRLGGQPVGPDRQQLRDQLHHQRFKHDLFRCRTRPPARRSPAGPTPRPRPCPSTACT